MQRTRRVGTLVTGRIAIGKVARSFGAGRFLAPPPNLVIPTEGRNLLVAGTVALQATADSSTAAPFRNDKGSRSCPFRQQEGVCLAGTVALRDSRFLHGYAVSE